MSCASSIDFQGDQGARGFDQIARPDQMIAAAALAAVAPRRRQTGHRRAAIGAILMDLQHGGGQRERAIDIVTNAGTLDSRQPVFPGAHCASQTTEKSSIRLDTASVAAASLLAPRPSANVACSGKLAHQGDRPGAGGGVLPGHSPVAVEVLPAVAGFGAADRAAPPCVGAVRVDRRQRQPERPLLRPQHGAAAEISRPHAEIAGRVAAQTRRQQRIGSQRRVSLQSIAHQQDVASLRGADPQRERRSADDDVRFRPPARPALASVTR